MLAVEPKIGAGEFRTWYPVRKTLARDVAAQITVVVFAFT